MKSINESLERNLRLYFSGEIDRRIQSKERQIENLQDNTEFSPRAVSYDQPNPGPTNQTSDKVAGYVVGKEEKIEELIEELEELKRRKFTLKKIFEVIKEGEFITEEELKFLRGIYGRGMSIKKAANYIHGSYDQARKKRQKLVNQLGALAGSSF